jgi:hypothetical protein
MTKAAHRERQLELPVMVNVNVCASTTAIPFHSRPAQPLLKCLLNSRPLEATPIDRSIYEAISAEYLKTKK